MSHIERRERTSLGLVGASAASAPSAAWALASAVPKPLPPCHACTAPQAELPRGPVILPASEPAR
eukprot:scaffold89885_cov66-Phaeocystis_antarctica.AAC.4